ncbi:Conserved_hypothetical protein [Hexamita inflata]|uniref:Uncharacterized protein n=1 Tax=Hexamita inflata TaxID=28002 RepID=A0AA86QNN5_9EUKA|nr:Conserved hypothetical protein [Hexamita inflata]
MYARVQLTQTFRTRYFLGTQMRTKNHPQQNRISNICDLYHFVKLTELNISENIIKDISVLKQLKCLKTLDLSNNLGVDITPLQYLSQLTFLVVQDCDIYEISALKPLINLKYLDLSHNNIIYFYPIREIDADIVVYDNLLDESSDFFTFFEVKQKEIFIDRQPNEQQILLAWKMKVVDTATSCIRDINTKHKRQISRKQITIDTLVSLQQKEQEIILSLADKIVQLFKQLNKSEQYQ